MFWTGRAKLMNKLRMALAGQEQYRPVVVYDLDDDLAATLHDDVRIRFLFLSPSVGVEAKQRPTYVGANTIEGDNGITSPSGLGADRFSRRL